MKKKTSKITEIQRAKKGRIYTYFSLGCKSSRAMKFLILTLFALICTVMTISSAYASVSAVSLTVPAPTVMSNGSGYYLAGTAATLHTYVFTVNAVNPGATASFGGLPPDNFNSVSIQIPTNGTNYINISTTNGTSISVMDQASNTVGGGTVNWTGTSNSVFQFTVRLNWDAEASAVSTKNIIATVTDVSGTSRTTTVSSAYGICSGISVINFAQSGNASDGFISTTHAAFNVSGTVVYDIPGYASENAVDIVADIDLVTSLTLELQGSPITSTPINTSSFNRTISANALAGLGGSYTWRITMPTVPTVKTSVSGLMLRVNTVHIRNTLPNGIEFSGGIGRGPDKTGNDNIPRYYRKYGTSGPRITLRALTVATDGSGTAMHGDTVFTVRMTNGALTGYFNVTIPSGQNSVTVNLPYDPASLAASPGASGSFVVAANTTEIWTYQVTAITSASGYDLNQTGDGNGTAFTAQIYWDNNRAPTAGTSYVTIASVSPAATSVTVYLTPEAYTAAAMNEDFYEYRIHFREQGGQWRIWDSAGDATLAWPVGSLNMNVSGPSKYTTIPNLKIFTTYEYYVTAVDVFGNESNGGSEPLPYDDLAPNDPTRIHRFKTLPYSIEVTLSDGITSYPDSSFANLTPTVRPLRESNIRVVLRIIGATELPEVVKVWFAVGDDSTMPNIVDTAGPTNTINGGAFVAGALESSIAKKTSANEWTAYLSTQTTIIRAGNNVRFVVESIKDGVSSFSDHILDLPTPDPNMSEWTFCIVSGTTFAPWPVRILNNVITSKNPLAYPSYYLTDPAYVTITVFDVRGQQIITLLDRAYRLGGQNIKENGWNGKNKAGRDCGPGLYFIHFKAKRASDGKVIIDEMKKAVIAR